MASVWLVMFVVLIGMAFWAGRLSVGPGADPPAVTPAAPRALAERDAFIEQLRELAWQHRDVSPELSTIIIDEITTHHRRQSGGGEG